MKMIDELKEERIRRGLSQQTVAELMSTTQSALSRAERNGNPTQDFLYRYQQALKKAAGTESVLELETIRILVSKVASKYGLAEVWLYGSVARGESRPDSDVDLLYRLASGSTLGMVKRGALLDELESLLGRKVSLTSLDSLERRSKESCSSRRFLDHIRPDMVKVA